MVVLYRRSGLSQKLAKMTLDLRDRFRHGYRCRVLSQNKRRTQKQRKRHAHIWSNLLKTHGDIEQVDAVQFVNHG